MVDVLSLDPNDLEVYLERQRANPVFPGEMSLVDNLKEVLRKANEFVPSEAGSILLDNPREKHPDRRKNRLTFLAAFGEKATLLVGQAIRADRGIAGYVYQSGLAYFTESVVADPHFDSQIDRQTQYRTGSLVAIPIRIGKEVCGVLELLNRQGVDRYSENDRDLLEIFAGYISVAIQNVLDGRQAQELARRDNLTGLYNDRYLHLALERAIVGVREHGGDLALLFLDLDFFKLVNDRHGHLAGSQVLREVGRLIRRLAEFPEAVVARYGGDEFVLAIPMELDTAFALAERIRRAVADAEYCSAPGEIQPTPLHLRNLTCSIGVATVLQHVWEGARLEETKSTLLKVADSAMYAAKEAGRNRTAVGVRREPAGRAATGASR